jgi:signal transduction histidine kinase
MQDKDIVFNVKVGNDVEQITADHDRLLQILLNLLANAGQHADKGGKINLSIQREQEHLLFSIADNGPGIQPGDLPHIFERFYRVDDSRNRHDEEWDGTSHCQRLCGGT